MNNIKEKPTGEPEFHEIEAEISKTEEIPRTEKGEVFESYKDFYSAYEAFLCPVVRIYGKRIENGELVDDPVGFIDARAHKISDRYANMNVYESSSLIACFRLNQKNIGQFRIEIIKKS